MVLLNLATPTVLQKSRIEAGEKPLRRIPLIVGILGSSQPLT